MELGSWVIECRAERYESNTAQPALVVEDSEGFVLLAVFIGVLVEIMLAFETIFYCILSFVNVLSIICF